MIPAKIYPLTIPAGGSFVLQTQGDYFKVLAASGSFQVTADTFGNLGQLDAGQGLERQPFSRLTFTDVTGAANDLQVLIAGAGFIDNRQFGEVTVIDAGRVRVLAGQAFMSGSLTTAPGAGNHNLAQLYNPSGTKRLIVTRITTGSSNLNSMRIMRRDSLLAPTAAFNPTITTKRPGLGASVATFTTGNTVGPLGDTIVRMIPVLGATKDDWDLSKEPIVLTQGKSIEVQTNAANTDLFANFEWWEETV